MADILKITAENFEEKVVNSDKPVVIDFWAAWCNPCRMFSPTFEACAKEMDDVVFAKVNVDEAGEIAAKFRVMSIPTIAVLKNGEVVNKTMGAISKAQLKELINRVK